MSNNIEKEKEIRIRDLLQLLQEQADFMKEMEMVRNAQAEQEREIEAAYAKSMQRVQQIYDLAAILNKDKVKEQIDLMDVV